MHGIACGLFDVKNYVVNCGRVLAKSKYYLMGIGLQILFGRHLDFDAWRLTSLQLDPDPAHSYRMKHQFGYIPGCLGEQFEALSGAKRNRTGRSGYLFHLHVLTIERSRRRNEKGMERKGDDS